MESLKALASRVLAAEHVVEHGRNSEENTRNKATPACSTFLVPPAGNPKHRQPAGGCGTALYGADGLRGDRPTMLVEGEFDALFVWQEAGHRVAAVATG